MACCFSLWGSSVVIIGHILVYNLQVLTCIEFLYSDTCWSDIWGTHCNIGTIHGIVPCIWYELVRICQGMYKNVYACISSRTDHRCTGFAPRILTSLVCIGPSSLAPLLPPPPLSPFLSPCLCLDHSCKQARACLPLTPFRPPTGDSSRCFVHPSLKPQASSLKPQASTLNPQPSSLNPQKDTLSDVTQCSWNRTLILNPWPSTSSIYPHPSSLLPPPSSLLPPPSSLITQPTTSTFKPCSPYIAFKHCISFATDLAANFGCNQFRITQSDCSRLRPVFVLARPNCPSRAETRPQEPSHWFCSQNFHFLLE